MQMYLLSRYIIFTTYLDIVYIANTMYLKAKTSYNLEQKEYKIIFCVRECLVI